MHRLLTWTLTTLLTLLSPLASAQSTLTLQELSTRMGQPAVVRADFTQTKKLAALKRPLVSEGRFVLSRKLGVLWQIQSPYRLGYLLGEESITEIDAQGVRRSRQLRDVVGLAQVSKVFRAVFNADTRALTDYFDIELQGSTEQWTMRLKPRQAHLAQALAELTLQGDRFITGIQIVEANGDQLNIRFKRAEATDALDAAEQSLFTGTPLPSKP